MIIDAKDAILGRLSTYVAKQALLGNKIDLINCEEALVTGKRLSILAHYVVRIDRKAPLKGPFLYRRPDMFVRRTIRGMLPWKRSRGREVYKNIKCHVGTPESLKSEKAIVVESANIAKVHSTDYIKVKEICRAIGGKQ
ncbi:MAG: 50S ribosomal protein L13 [Nanoarchaeota archaeon]